MSLPQSPLVRSHHRCCQRGSRRIALGATLGVLLLSFACEEPSWWHTEKAIVPICERVLACGGWGYADPGECQDGLVGNAALGTACADAEAYLDCVHGCCWDACRDTLSRDACRACQPPDCNQCDYLACEAFSACEDACRQKACPTP